MHRKVFADIEVLCSGAGVTMTLYVADLTLSGVHATRTLLFDVKARIQRCSLPTHKEKYVAAGHVGIVTGLAVERGDLHFRNKQHKAIVQTIESIRAGDETLTESLRGKLAATKAVDPAAAAGLIERFSRRVMHPRQKQT